VRDLPFVVIAVEQIGGDLWIALAVEQVDAQRTGVIVPGGVIGLLGKLIDLHMIPFRRCARMLACARQQTTPQALANAGGTQAAVRTDLAMASGPLGLSRNSTVTNVRSVSPMFSRSWT